LNPLPAIFCCPPHCSSPEFHAHCSGRRFLSLPYQQPPTSLSGETSQLFSVGLAGRLDRLIFFPLRFSFLPPSFLFFPIRAKARKLAQLHGLPLSFLTPSLLIFPFFSRTMYVNRRRSAFFTSCPFLCSVSFITRSPSRPGLSTHSADTQPSFTHPTPSGTQLSTNPHPLPRIPSDAPRLHPPMEEWPTSEIFRNAITRPSNVMCEYTEDEVTWCSVASVLRRIAEKCPGCGATDP